jgi:Putative adhesin
MMRNLRTRAARGFALLVVLASVAGCDIVTAEFRSQETAEWRRSYELQPGGRVEISNINGQIDVEPSGGNTVEVVAVKVAKAASAEAAREALGRIEILETASPGSVKVETRLPRSSGLFHRGGGEVRYTVKVPAAADGRFATVNGGIELVGLTGRLEVETTNGGIRARDIGGPIAASTTNGGVDVDVTRMAESGVTLECTNGGIKLRLPSDAKATISASVTNGGIETAGFSALDTTESTRRRLEARLNGGGPIIRIEGTNGGIRIDSR